MSLWFKNRTYAVTYFPVSSTLLAIFSCKAMMLTGSTKGQLALLVRLEHLHEAVDRVDRADGREPR